MKIKGLTNMSLIVMHCLWCDEISPQGFPNQMDWELGKRNKVRTLMTCSKCQCTQQRVYSLTSGRAIRPRLIEWISIGLFLAKILPRQWMQYVCHSCLWLEANVPL